MWQFLFVHATFFKILRENTWKLDACKYYKVFACRYWYVECMIMSIFVPCMQHFSNSTQKQVFALNRQRENKLSRRILKKAACREWKLHASISAFADGAAAFPQPCPPSCLCICHIVCVDTSPLDKGKPTLKYYILIWQVRPPIYNLECTGYTSKLLWKPIFDVLF